MLESVDASIEHVRAIVFSKATVEKQKTNLNKININGLKDLVVLLKTFQDVILLIQTGDRPTLHMVYVCLNKLKLHLNGEDINSDGEPILINDRHDGNDCF